MVGVKHYNTPTSEPKEHYGNISLTQAERKRLHKTANKILWRYDYRFLKEPYRTRKMRELYKTKEEL